MTFSLQSAGKPWSLTKDDAGCDVFQVRHGDVATWIDTPTSERCELADSVKQPFDVPVWVSIPFFIEPGQPSSARWCALGQFHQSEDSTDGDMSPVFEQEYVNEKLVLYARGGKGSTTATTTTTVMCEVPIERGVWLHAVHCIRFSRGGIGHVRSWLNGSRIHESDVLIGYDDAVGPYFKYGVYRAASPESLTVRYGTVEVGTTSLQARTLA